MKKFKLLSVLLVLAMLAGFAGAAKPEEVQAQTPTRLTVLEFVSSTA